MLTQKSLLRGLPTAILNVVHHTFAQRLEVLSDACMVENARNGEFMRRKEEWTACWKK